MSLPPPQNGKHYTQDDPAMDRYRSVRDTLKANGFVNNPNLSEYDQIYLHSIQGTYKVKQEHWADLGYSFQIMLVWDQDRIWGVFDFGSYKGVLMVDHGPEREPPEWSRNRDDDEAGDDEAAPPVYYDFTWKGTCSQMPDTIINNPLITKGKIEFGVSRIRGFFEGMFGAGLPGECCSFDGTPLFGPRRVPRSLQSFIDGWNDLEYFGEDETVRLAPSSVGNVSQGQIEHT